MKINKSSFTRYLIADAIAYTLDRSDLTTTCEIKQHAHNVEHQIAYERLIEIADRFGYQIRSRKVQDELKNVWRETSLDTAILKVKLVDKHRLTVHAWTSLNR